MRVVGLVSGGKDSIWNLHYCHYFQHEVLCLAHLAPPEGVQEMDSYMYQTVGSELVNSIAEAMELPLIRRSITGAPKNLENGSYVPQEGDEVEDLFLLLQEVLQAFPVDAVSCGAILSDYQRCRVENVCSRLGLKVFAFLWRQEQPLLLNQMIAGGLDARIVKVACMGLDQRHIGKSILDSSFAAHVMQLGKKWGVHVCGEGGEYESAVFDAPLFNRRLALPEGSMEACGHPSGEADGVALMSVREAPLLEAKEKELSGLDVLEEYSSLRYYHETFPPMSEDRLADLVTEEDSSCWCRPLTAASSTAGDSRSMALGPAGPALKRIGTLDLFATSTLDVLSMELSGTWDSAAAQCDALLQSVSTWLAERFDRCMQDVAFAEVQVSDLSCFEAVNAVYARHFSENPPARVCIETPLPTGVDVRLRLLLRPHEGASGRDALRVQSISTWAMACIGPYSQAQRCGDVLCSSGVLGLVPHSMALPDAKLLEGLAQPEAELWMLMRSLHNVLQVMGSGFQEIFMAQVYTTAGVDGSKICRQVLAYFRELSGTAVMPLIAFAEVPKLPKGACVEMTVLCSPTALGESQIKIVEAASVSEATALAGVVRSCVEALATEGALDALQVQYCPGTCTEPELHSALQASLSTTDAASCAASVMPVVSLHPGTSGPSASSMRFTGFVSPLGSMRRLSCQKERFIGAENGYEQKMAI